MFFSLYDLASDAFRLVTFRDILYAEMLAITCHKK